jgi:hypothetical protein
MLSSWRMYEMHLALFLKAGCDKYEENGTDLLHSSGHNTERRAGNDGYVSRGQLPCHYPF